MANITPINGSMKLPQAWPIIDENIRKVNADIMSHKTDVAAHTAEHIEIGNVNGASNVAEAFDKQSERIDNLIITGGDSSPEVSDARGGFPVLGARLDALTDYLSYMPINGGDFDGNDPAGPVIDGGTY